MKKLLAVLLSTFVIFSFGAIISYAQTPTFTDVDPTTDVGKDIQKLFDAGIINGNGDGTFAPQNGVTRAELCKMVNNLKGYKTVSAEGFSDVTPDKWYYTHVLIGKQAGYINGFPDGSFRGDDYITREQVCAIICRAFGIYDLGLSAGITDGVSDWALPYVNALVTNKLIKLEDGNTFRATEPMKRGELSTSLSNFVVSAPSTGTPGAVGGIGGSTGGDTITPPEGGTTTPENPEEMTREEIIEANSEVLTYLRKVKKGLENSKGNISMDFTGDARRIVTIVHTCVEGAIEVGASGEKLISRDYIYEKYDTEISQAKAIYDEMEKVEGAQANFRETVLLKIPDIDTQEFLLNMFL